MWKSRFLTKLFLEYSCFSKERSCVQKILSALYPSYQNGKWRKQNREQFYDQNSAPLFPLDRNIPFSWREQTTVDDPGEVGVAFVLIFQTSRNAKCRAASRCIFSFCRRPMLSNGSPQRVGRRKILAVCTTIAWQRSFDLVSTAIVFVCKVLTSASVSLFSHFLQRR